MLWWNLSCALTLCLLLDCQQGTALRRASDIPEECQALRLHPEEGFETWQQEALQHLTACKCLVKGQGRPTSRCSDNECSFPPAPHLPGQQWLCSFGFLILIPVVSTVHILKPTLMLERLTLFFLFCIKALF